MQKPYVHQEYPKWRYHATEKAQVVNDPAHEDEVAHTDEGWADSPTLLAPVEEKKKRGTR